MQRLLFLFFFLLLLLAVTPVFSQQTVHFAQLHGNGYLDKKQYMAGYGLGWRRLIFSVSAGKGSGSDEQFVLPGESRNWAVLSALSNRTTVEPEDKPKDSYIERCSSTYDVKMARLGFTVFTRKNENSGHSRFTGPHFGVDAVFMQTLERQELTYRSNSEATSYVYSGEHRFSELGAASHVGWQFAFLREQLFVDLRAGMTFYYPFMPNPNLESPFAGNRLEGQVTFSWRFGKGEGAAALDNEEGGMMRGKI